MNRRLKRNGTTAVVALSVLTMSILKANASWILESTESNGIWGQVCSCVKHGDTQIKSWDPGTLGPTPTVCLSNCCLGGHVYSRGSVTKTFRWNTVDPKNDPPPFRQYVKHVVGLTHKIDGQPAGTATCSLGTPTPADPYHVTAYSWEDGSSGRIRLTYNMDVDVMVDHGNCTASADVGLSIDFNAAYTGPTAQLAKVPPSQCPSMPTWPQRLRRVLDRANFPPGDPVNLATGEHIYAPNPDISVYNPYGPAVIYQRNYLSTLAQDGKHSLGLPVGWNDGFDIKFVAQTPNSWGLLKLVHPNDAEESATPVLLNGNPTGTFIMASGTGFMVTGVPSTTTGQWDQITITHKDRTKWIFSRVAPDTYLLSAIANRMGRSIKLVRDSLNGNKIASIQDDQSTPVTLLSFTYQDGYLSMITDCYGRKVKYGYITSSGMKCLRTVSQISNMDTIPARSTYDYKFVGTPAIPHLSQVSVPNPTGSGLTVEKFQIDNNGRVNAITDGNYNVHRIYYTYPDATRVTISNAQGKVEQDFLVSFDINHSNVITGIMDRNGNVTKKDYADTSNLFLPTKITDKLNKTIETTYDQYGNVLTVKDARGTVTRYLYDYDVFPLGRLRTITEADNLPQGDPARKPDTSICYYEPSGLVQSVSYPKPGSVGPTAETVTTSYTYDLVDDRKAGTRGLGNILSITKPGNNDTESIKTTYYYGPYNQVRLGLPFSITDSLNHSTYFSYDARGNLKARTDALGNRVDMIYNIADQVTDILHPHAASAP